MHLQNRRRGLSATLCRSPGSRQRVAFVFALLAAYGLITVTGALHIVSCHDGSFLPICMIQYASSMVCLTVFAHRISSRRKGSRHRLGSDGSDGDVVFQDHENTAHYKDTEGTAWLGETVESADGPDEEGEVETLLGRHTDVCRAPEQRTFYSLTGVITANATSTIVSGLHVIMIIPWCVSFLVLTVGLIKSRDLLPSCLTFYLLSAIYLILTVTAVVVETSQHGLWASDTNAPVTN